MIDTTDNTKVGFRDIESKVKNVKSLRATYDDGFLELIEYNGYIYIGYSNVLTNPYQLGPAPLPNPIYPGFGLPQVGNMHNNVFNNSIGRPSISPYAFNKPTVETFKVEEYNEAVTAFMFRMASTTPWRITNLGTPISDTSPPSAFSSTVK